MVVVVVVFETCDECFGIDANVTVDDVVTSVAVAD